MKTRVRIPIGSLLYTTLESSTRHILTRLYAGFSIPDKPVTKKHISKAERNADIIARHQAGENLSEVAREYGISPQRAHQIVMGKSN